MFHEPVVTTHDVVSSSLDAGLELRQKGHVKVALRNLKQKGRDCIVNMYTLFIHNRSIIGKLTTPKWYIVTNKDILHNSMQFIITFIFYHKLHTLGQN